MAIDTATIHQAQLLAESLKQQMPIEQWFAQIYPLLTIMNNQNKDDVIQALLLLMGLPPDDVKKVVKQKKLEESFTTIIMAKYMSITGDEKRTKELSFALKKALKNIKTKNDTSNVLQVVHRVENGTKIYSRRTVFEKANQITINEASKRGDLVVWRARAQADGACRYYNNMVMTPEKFAELWPIHFNCMCTAELIPNGYKGRKYVEEDTETGAIVA